MTQIQQTDTPQSEPLDDGQALNNAGGYVYQVTPLTLFKRFLVLGSDSGCYHATAQQLTLENAANVMQMVRDGRGGEMVDMLVEYSESGRTAKQDNIIFVLAILCKYGDPQTKDKAYAAIERVCRIPTTLFMLVEFLKTFADTPQSVAAETDKSEKDAGSEKEVKRKAKRASPPNKGKNWGRGQRRAIASWYNGKDATSLARLMTKYKNRNNWTHRDLLLCAHVKPDTPLRSLLYRYSVKGWDDIREQLKGLASDAAATSVYEYLGAIESVKKNAVDVNAVVHAIQEYKLEREHLMSESLNEKQVWRALLKTMGMTAVIRNLSKMTAIELLQPSAPESQQVIDMLNNEQAIRKARLHPFNMLVAENTYASGRGVKGSLTWKPVPKITDALEACYYKSFHNVEPTNKRFLLAVDVSGSMDMGTVMGSDNVSPRVAAAAMAMVTLRTEPHAHIVGFSHKLVPLEISKTATLPEVVGTMSKLSMGSTDCAQPMLYALEQKLEVDVFVVYTDNETWYGKVHPSQALKQYREKTGIPAKLIVVAFQAFKGTIADPKDAGMMDMEGFDSAAPEVMRAFIQEEV
ncbi:60 kDa SS-A/Ro ribonucleoprotein [Sorochytrium milnesiophthora]